MDLRTLNRTAYEIGGDLDKARQVAVMVEHITALENLQKEVEQFRRDLCEMLAKLNTSIKERL